MFYEIVATLVSAFAGAGVVLLLNKISVGRFPKWVMPVGAGLAMITTTVANEYAWFDRTRALLPEGIEVVQEIANRSVYRPWTYVAPFVERFAAVDKYSLRTHDAHPDLRMVDMIFMDVGRRWKKMSALIDCENARRAPLIDAIKFSDSGEVLGVEWVSAGADDPYVTMVCNLEVPS